MTLDDAVRKFKRHLMAHFNGKNGTGGWLKCDCRTICDACTNKRYKPFYISVSTDNPVYMKCFKISSPINRCLTMDDFSALNFTDSEAIKLLISRQGRANIKLYGSDDPTALDIKDYTLTVGQHNYIKRRTGLSMTVSDMVKYRVIPNVQEVMEDNFGLDSEEYKIYENTGIPQNKGNVSFGTEDYGMIIYRGIDDNKKAKIKLTDGTLHGYTLQRDEEVKTLVIAEGVFDIINIYNSFAMMPNALYIASLGFGNMESDILYYYQKYMETVEQLVIFADSDVELPYGKFTYNKYAVESMIKNISSKIGEDTFKKIYVCYNSKGKDFGDLSKEIHGEKIEIK